MTQLAELTRTTELADHISQTGLTLTHAEVPTTYTLSTAGYEIDAEWDAFVAATPGGHYTQSAAWAHFRAAYHWNMERVIVRADGVIVAGAQCLYRSLAPFVAVGVVVLAPITARDDPALVDLVLQGVRALARRHHIRYLVQQSPTGTQDEDVLLKRGFIRARLREGIEPATTRLDLRQDVETILANMDKARRRKSRQAQQKGLIFREGGESDLPIFFDVYQRISERKNFAQYPRHLIEQVWKAFAPAGYIRLFIVEADGAAIAALMTLAFGESCSSWKGGWTGERADDHPNDFMYWSIITWAKEHNFAYFDFLGLDSTVAVTWEIAEGKVPREVAEHTFKMSWGGGITYLSKSFVYIPNRLLRWAYRVAPKNAKGEFPLVMPLLWWTYYLR